MLNMRKKWSSSDRRSQIGRLRKWRKFISKIRPDTMAPAAIPEGTPNVVPIPISATPTVPAVDQELPVIKETTEDRTQAVTKKKEGFKIFNPHTIIEGTIPDQIQTPIRDPINRRMSTGFNTFFNDSKILSSRTSHLTPRRIPSKLATVPERIKSICAGPSTVPFPNTTPA